MTQSIMIIGAGPGISQAVARRFGREGWNVVLTSRSGERLAPLVAELTATGVAAIAIPADATDPFALRSAIAEAERQTGGLTALHYNAAALRQQDLFSMRDEEIGSDLAINVAGGLHTIRAGVAHFGARGGTILVTGGGLALSPHESYASLGAGKAALRNVVQGLTGPLAARGIRLRLATVATAVAPDSPEAQAVADQLWTLATGPQADWETVYPAKDAAQSGDAA